MFKKCFALVWMVFACLAVPCRAADENARPAEGSKINAEADALLHRVCDFYKKSKSWKGNIDVEFHIAIQGQKEDIQTSMSMAVRKPNKLVIKATGKFTGALYLDSTTMTMVISDMKQYRQSAQPALEKLKDLKEVSMMSVGASNFILPLFSDDPYKELLEAITEARIVGKEKVNGIECQKLLLVQEPAPIFFWIAEGDKPLLLKSAPDMSAKFKEEKEASRPLPDKFEYNTTVNNQEFDLELGDELFKAEIPEGFERVEKFGTEADEEEEHPLLGKPAPELKMDLLDGGKFDLAEHKGKNIVVLDFWATWCGPCRMGLPLVIKATDAFKGKSVEFFAVNQADEPKVIQKFLQKENHTMKVPMDTENSTTALFQIPGIPFTIIIDKQGIIQAIHIGFDENEETIIKDELQKLVDGESLLKPKAKK